MDAGIIQSFKMQYRNLLLRKRIQAIEDAADFKINLLDALHLVRKAWNLVQPTTIERCFRKAEFVRRETAQLFVGFEGIF
jgi:hypothetical protein